VKEHYKYFLLSLVLPVSTFTVPVLSDDFIHTTIIPGVLVLPLTIGLQLIFIGFAVYFLSIKKYKVGLYIFLGTLLSFVINLFFLGRALSGVF